MFCDIYRSDYILITDFHLSIVSFSSSLLFHLIVIDIFMILLVSYYINTTNILLNQLMPAKDIPRIF